MLKDKVTLLSTNRYNCNVLLIIGRVLSEIKMEWLAAAVIAVTTMDTKLEFGGRAMKLNW